MDNITDSGYFFMMDNITDSILQNTLIPSYNI